ncbi:biotin/lipoyl-binding protein [Fundidesulfovibrio terrae]|uniref:biotin/lipoyl-binding protein n=1 Tax=Fundidesulfovibrio terrae TaxID=2922866 RepID=UPI001FAE8357|nr:biotin/lipoyl-binding protein [Fundidesulfovibrio terrae]
MSAEDKKKKLTVFKSDRHEDLAGCVFAGLVVVIVLTYMAFFVKEVDIKAPADGRIVAVKAAKDAHVKEGDVLFSYETKKKKFEHGQVQEAVVTVDFQAKVPGKILSISRKDGDAVKKNDLVLVMDHESGTLP